MARDQRPPGTLAVQLLRKSVSALQAERPHCADCHRTPLVGERVFIYGEKPVCELCRSRRRDEPVRAIPVRGWEHGTAVRPTARAVRAAA